mmetsp:Transcript_75033/g.176103  ORF Transcript_75033/g.176103 Transcript_75033/m.176103 type:complete len:355 (+) Transcript_75033:4572-5636(+)
MRLRTKSLGLSMAARLGPHLLTAQVPNPPHEGERRCTNGFSSEKFTEVRNGHVCRGTQARRPGAAGFLLPHILHRGAQRLRDPRSLPAGRRGAPPLGLPRRRGALHLRRALQAGEHPACAGAPRAGRRPCRRRLCASDRRGRRRPGDLGPGRHECHHRHRDGLYGLDPDGHHHGPGAHAGDRPGCLPGVRHGGHHAANRQAQLPRQGRARSGADAEEGLPHRPHRPSRPGRRGHPQGCLACQDCVQLPGPRRDAVLQPGEEGPQRPDPQGRAAAAAGQAPVHLHRRRGHPGRSHGRAAPAGRPARLPLHQHADGPGRNAGHRPAFPRHARHARHLRGQHDHAALRCAVGRGCTL